MANVYVDLPLPLLNGPGAAVNTSSMGAERTIVVGGSFPGCLLTIEVSLDAAATWAPVCSFQDQAGEVVIAVAAEFMRVSVAGRKTTVPFAANVDVGSNDAGGQFLAIPLPAGNGTGPVVNASALGTFQTFAATGTFPGAAIALEVSEDGTSWQTVTTWAGYGGVVSRSLTSFRYRATVSGRSPSVPFTAALSVGAINDVTGGAGITELTTDVLAGPGAGVQVATVVGLQGTPLSGTAPAAGEVLAYNGGTSQWEPTALPADDGITELTTDVLAGPGSGTQAATVVGLQGTAVSGAAPAGGDVLTYNIGTTQWEPAAPAPGGITELTGDVVGGPGTGTVAVTVAGIEGVPVDATPPVAGDVLQYNGVWWTPTALAPSGITELTGDVTAGPGTGSQSATVEALQGYPVAAAAPTSGQVLTWDGAQWVPGSSPGGGSGGGGIILYCNEGTAPDAPTTNIPLSTNGLVSVKELGKTSEVATTTVTSSVLSTVSWDVICGFVTDLGVPGVTEIPAGIWDLNIWASSTAAQPDHTLYRVSVYTYDGVNPPTVIATGSGSSIFDPATINQYSTSVLVPLTTILATDRIYLEISARATTGGIQATFSFGGNTPTHVHTTLPSVAGTGIVHVVNGAFVSPASPVILSSATEVTGVLPVANGGTGTSSLPANGELLIGNAGAYSVASLTAGANVSITPGAGSLTIATTSGPNYWQRVGTVLSPATADDQVKISGYVNPVLALEGQDVLFTITDLSAGPVWQFDSNGTVPTATWFSPVFPDRTTSVNPSSLDAQDATHVTSVSAADGFASSEVATSKSVQLAVIGGTATLKSYVGIFPLPLNLDVTEVQIQGNPGAAGEVLTSQGAGLPPQWAAPTTPSLAVIFDDSVPGANVNIRSDRAANQSPIDNTLAQITNLGSQDGLYNALAAGATAPASTIGGGDDNQAVGDYTTCGGGAGNNAFGPWSTVPGGLYCESLGDYSFATGYSAVAPGIASVAAGSLTFASGAYSCAVGSQTVSSGDASFAAGDATVASANGCVAFGGFSTASALYAFATGYLTVADAPYSSASGNASTVQTGATAGHAEGNATEVSGEFGHSEGSLTQAVGKASHAQGLQSQALRDTQSAHASGSSLSPFGVVEHNARSPQASVLVLRAATGGLGVSEAVELIYADSTVGIVLAPNVAYTFKVVAVAGGSQAGPVYGTRAFELSFVARRISGTSTIVASGPSSSYGDAASSTWTLAASVGAAPDRISLIFDTGAGTPSACYVSARVEFVEYQFLPDSPS